jgi:pimeloyl-ACP methyl ester carboxylesterase
MSNSLSCAFFFLLLSSVTSFSNNLKSSRLLTNLNVAETIRDGMIEIDGNTVCYDVVKASPHSGPPILYLPGLIRPKSEGKSVNLRSFCRKNGFSFLSADYFGTGKSTGAVIDGTVSKWTSDTIFLIENLLGKKQGKVVLVGHGVGAWISFLIASKRPDLVRGVVGIAADPDFTEELLWKSFSEEIKEKIMTEGVAEIKWGASKYSISRNLIVDGRNNLLLTGGKGMSLPQFSCLCRE